MSMGVKEKKRKKKKIACDKGCPLFKGAYI